MASAARVIETTDDGPALDPVARAQVEFGYYRYTPPADLDGADADVAATAQPVQALDAAEPGEMPELASAHETSIDAVSDPATASGQVLPREDETSAYDSTAQADSSEPYVSETADVSETAERAEIVPSDGGEVHADDDEDDEEETAEEEQVESVGGDDAMEEVPERQFRPRRQYKIQEVIKRRQVMLIQVVKEERGNKGAALTTYLSLAGRYAVLMPNTARGGGISRKITSAQDRTRLKEVVQDLDVPEGMGVILRTAGAARSQPEIKRDFEYLLRAWEQVRDLTLKSSAPTLVYEEGSLIKRSIRDLFNKEIDEVIVAGDNGYSEARDFMKMLMPTATRTVKPYREGQPLFSRMGIESQLDAMFSPTVQLRSGGYIVINQTEALVSIDVNSGRSTREHHIEDTALKTNLEASEEVARQLQAARPRRADRHRLHRHGREAQQPRGRAQAERLPQARPGAHPGRPHLALRAAGDVAPAHPRQRAGKLDRALPALRRHRPCAVGRLGRAAVAAQRRGDADEGRNPQSRRAHPHRGGALRAEPQARPPARSGKRLQGRDRHQCGRGPAGVRDRSRRTGAHAGSGEGPDCGAGRDCEAAGRRT